MQILLYASNLVFLHINLGEYMQIMAPIMAIFIDIPKNKLCHRLKCEFPYAFK